MNVLGRSSRLDGRKRGYCVAATAAIATAPEIEDEEAVEYAEPMGLLTA